MEAERLWPSGPVFLQAPHIRLTADTVLLADFARVRAGERGADLGCASGALMLLLLWREPALWMTGLELSAEACALAEENLQRNGLSGRAEVRCGDLRETVKRLPNGSFNFVIANPPYYPVGQGRISPDRERAAARGETDCSLEELCAAASRLCCSGGRVFLCYRPERLTELLREMSRAHLEPKRMRLVHHSADSDASLVLVEGRKDGHPGLNVEPPLLIRDADGRESAEYRRICHC